MDEQVIADHQVIRQTAEKGDVVGRDRFDHSAREIEARGELFGAGNAIAFEGLTPAVAKPAARIGSAVKRGEHCFLVVAHQRIASFLAK